MDRAMSPGQVMMSSAVLGWLERVARVAVTQWQTRDRGSWSVATQSRPIFPSSTMCSILTYVHRGQRCSSEQWQVASRGNRVCQAQGAATGRLQGSGHPPGRVTSGHSSAQSPTWPGRRPQPGGRRGTGHTPVHHPPTWQQHMQQTSGDMRHTRACVASLLGPSCNPWLRRSPSGALLLPMGLAW